MIVDYEPNSRAASAIRSTLSEYTLKRGDLLHLTESSYVSNVLDTVWEKFH